MKDLLPSLDAIEPSSPIWPKVFELAQRKIAEAELLRQQFAAALESTRKEADAKYFSLIIAEWPPNASLNYVGLNVHIELLAELKERLVEHAALRRVPADRLTRAEDNQRISRLMQLGVEIDSLDDRLRALLGVNCPSDLKIQIESTTLEQLPEGQLEPQQTQEPEISGLNVETSVGSPNVRLPQEQRDPQYGELADQERCDPQLHPFPEDLNQSDLNKNAQQATQPSSPECLGPEVSNQSPHNPGTNASEPEETSTVAIKSPDTESVLKKDLPEAEDNVAPQLLTTTQDLGQGASLHPTPPLPSEREVSERIWRYMDRGDMVRAYWLAHAMEELNLTPPVGPGLLWLLQTIEWRLTPHHPAASSYSFEPKESWSDLQSDDAPTRSVSFLRFAAALEPWLFGWGRIPDSWLCISAHCPALQRLYDALVQLRWENPDETMFLKIAGHQALEDDIRRSGHAVKEWHGSIFVRFNDHTKWDPRTHKFDFTGQTMAELLRKGSEIGLAVEIIAVNDRDRAEQVRSIADAWLSLDEFQRRFRPVRRRLMGNAKDLPGPDIWEHFHRPVKTGCQLLKDWCRAIQTAGRDGNSTLEHTRAVLDGVKEALRDATTSVQQIVNGSADSSERTAGHRLAIALSNLSQRLRLNGVAPESPESLDGPTLEGMFSRFLLQCPVLVFHSDGILKSGQAESLIAVLTGSEVRPEDQVKTLRNWIAQRDFVRFDRLFEMLPNIPARSELDNSRRLAEETVAGELVTRISHLRERILDLYRGGVLTESVFAEYENYCQLWSQQSASDWRELYSSMEELEASLTSALYTFLNLAKERWARLRTRLEADSALPESLRSQVCAHAETQIANASSGTGLVNLEGTIAQIAQILDEGELVRERLQALLVSLTTPGKGALQEFLAAQPALLRYLREYRLRSILGDLRENNLDSMLEVVESPEVRTAFGKALEAWTYIADKRSTVKNDLAWTWVPSVLRFLGFQRTSGDGRPAQPDAKIDTAHSIKLTVAYSSAGKSSLPAFGSIVGDSCSVQVVWSDVSVDSLITQLDEQGWPLYVIYLGALTLEQRSTIAVACRKGSRATLFLDEALLLFLARRTLHRLETFFSVAVPFSGVNPYVPDEGRVVAPEMFVGRRAQIEALVEHPKNRLIFGGRQLGKSAILAEVKRRIGSTYPDCIVVSYVVRQNAPEVIWEIIDRELRSVGILKDKAAAAGRETVASRIRIAYQNGETRRVLVLLDEVEDFLQREVETGSLNLNELEQLSNAVGHGTKFHVVLAGNYHTQRYARANIAVERFDPLVVGPLEPADAIDLIRRPMRALGFEFGSSDSEHSPAIQRILHYTVYQAGLVQIFMHYFVEYLRRARAGSGLPCYVQVDDIEKFVESDSRKVLRLMRETFQKTVGLENEYGLVLYTIVLDQGDGALEDFYDAERILDAVEVYWPDGVSWMRSNGEPDKWLRGRLEEMVGLGLLLKNAQNEYRIRNRSLIHLYGGIDGIRKEMERLQKCRPASEGPIDYRHEPSSSSGVRRFSPFSAAEIRRLSADDRRLRIIQTTPLSGGDNLSSGLNRASATALESQGIVGLPGFEKKPFADCLEEFLRASDRNHEYLVSISVPLDAGGQVDEWLACAARIFRDLGRGRKVRLNLLIGPEEAGCWFHHRLQSNQLLFPDSVADIRLHKWSLHSIECALADLGKQKSFARQIFDTTGGWHKLLEELFSRFCVGENPSDAIRTFEQDFAATGATQAFTDLGIRKDTWLTNLLERVCREGGAILSEWDDIPELDRHVAAEVFERFGFATREQDMLFPEPILQRLLARSSQTSSSGAAR